MTVVILSKNSRNLRSCLEALYRNEPGVSVIVVDDGLTERPAGPDYLVGEKPFIFARNANIGIRAAGGDVVLLNDDAVLVTRGGLTSLITAMPPAFGIVSAACNNVGNLSQYPRGVGLRDEPRMVCFVCAYIPRSTIDRVGLLDERFTAYGFEDDDYCLRVRKAGLRIGVYDGCFVDHGQLRSTFRGEPGRGGDLTIGRQIFIEKWGQHPL